MAVVARGHRSRTSRLAQLTPSPVPTEPESSPLRLDCRHLRRACLIPARYRGSVQYSKAPAGPAPEAPPIVPGREVEKQTSTSSPGRFFRFPKQDIIILNFEF